MIINNIYLIIILYPFKKYIYYIIKNYRTINDYKYLDFFLYIYILYFYFLNDYKLLK